MVSAEFAKNLKQHKAEEPKKVSHIRKNQIDPTAGLVYSLGCSLVHFTLFICLFFVKRPNINKAIKSDQTYVETLKASGATPSFPTFCELKAAEFELEIRLMFALHCIATFVSLYREVKSNNVGRIANFMRMMEIIVTCGYIGVIVMSLNSYNALEL